MRTITATALAIAALTSAALADGAVELTSTQLDQITAGVSVDNNRARRPADDVIDTTRGFSRPTSDPEGRGIQFENRLVDGLQILRGGRVANPGVNVSFVPLDQMDWVSARFFAGSADDPFFFDIPGVIREGINPQRGG